MRDEWHRSAPRRIALLEAGQDEAVADDPATVTGLRAAGFPTQQARTAALRQLVLEAPAAVIA